MARRNHVVHLDNRPARLSEACYDEEMLQIAYHMTVRYRHTGQSSKTCLQKRKPIGNFVGFLFSPAFARASPELFFSKTGSWKWLG
jgi:hypothetical protein